MKKRMHKKKGQGGSRDSRLWPPCKKAQGGEMMGLVVIVILLIVILGIYIRLSSGPKETTTATKESIIGKNVVSSILNANICPGKSMEDGIKACANGEDACDQDGCEIAGKEADKMLKSTIGKDYALNNYQFYINTTSGKEIIRKGAERLVCPKIGGGTSIKIPYTRQIKAGAATIGSISLTSCA